MSFWIRIYSKREKQGGNKMTKEQAVKELLFLSHGSLATLTRKERQERGLEATYDNIDSLFNEKLEKILHDEVNVLECENWLDVWNLIN